MQLMPDFRPAPTPPSGSSFRFSSGFLAGGFVGLVAASVGISLLAGSSMLAGGAWQTAADGSGGQVRIVENHSPAAQGGRIVLRQPSTRSADVDRSAERRWSGTDPFRPMSESASPPALTPEFVERCLEVAAVIQPSLAEGLRALRDRDPVAFEQRLRRSTRLLSLAELRDRDPRLFDLKLVELRVDAEVLRIARELRQLHGEGGPSDRIKTLETQLLGQVRLQVAFTIHARTDYLCRLQEEVARLERELAQDRERPEALVEQRLRGLLGDAYHEGFGALQR